MGSWRVQRTMLNLPHDGVAEFEQSLEDALKSHMFINFLNPDRVEVVAMTFTPSITERMDNDMIVSYDEMEDHLADEASAMLAELDDEGKPEPELVDEMGFVGKTATCVCGNPNDSSMWHSVTFPCRSAMEPAASPNYDDI